jgi:hypothetical protein
VSTIGLYAALQNGSNLTWVQQGNVNITIDEIDLAPNLYVYGIGFYVFSCKCEVIAK